MNWILNRWIERTHTRALYTICGTEFDWEIIGDCTEKLFWWFRVIFSYDIGAVSMILVGNTLLSIIVQVFFYCRLKLFGVDCVFCAMFPYKVNDIHFMLIKWANVDETQVKIDNSTIK